MTRKLIIPALIVALIGLIGAGAAMAEDPIIVGAPLLLTGPYASTGQAQERAFEMAVDETNAAGGLVGRQLKLVKGDASDAMAENVAAVGERLIATGADVVMTGWCSLGPEDIAVYGQYDVPYYVGTAQHLASDAIQNNLPEFGNIFDCAWDEYTYSYTLRDHLFTIPKRMGWTPPNKKIALLKVDLPYCIDPADKFKKIAEGMGYEFVIDEISQFGKVDWGTVLTKIERAQPSYILLFLLDPTDTARFQQQFYDRFNKKGLNAIIVGQYSPGVPEYRAITGRDVAEGVIWMGGAVRTWDPRTADYVNRWKEKYGEMTFDSYAVHCRDIFEIWAQAVRRAGSADDYAEVARLTRESSYDGMWANYVFAPQDQTTIYGEYLMPVDWLQIQDLENVEIFPEMYAPEGAHYKKPPWIKD